MSSPKSQKNQNSARRTHRVRSAIKGRNGYPRLSVHISNLHVTAQIIDDKANSTLAYATTVGRKMEPASLTAKAEIIGKDIADAAKKAKVKKVVLDRGRRSYHGRIKVLADAARSGGLEF